MADGVMAFHLKEKVLTATHKALHDMQSLLLELAL